MDPCDDPYKILANNLVSECSDKELSRFLHDAKIIKKRILREAAGADFYGNFIDCVTVDLVNSGKYREIKWTLKDTAAFFYKHLDIPRLREEIKYYCQRYGRNVE